MTMTKVQIAEAKYREAHQLEVEGYEKIDRKYIEAFGEERFNTDDDILEAVLEEGRKLAKDLRVNELWHEWQKELERHRAAK